MTIYCRSLISYAQAYHQQFKDTSLDPNSKDPVWSLVTGYSGSVIIKGRQPLSPDERDFTKYSSLLTLLQN